MQIRRFACAALVVAAIVLPTPPGAHARSAACPIQRPEEFHTYALEWTPQTLSLTTNIDFGGYLPADIETSLPQTMQIDYVKVWD